ncbi:spore coat protein [Virgibacillus siamensis]|uniref:spore coat protein n=1 Tax=Virgibacillus siamensis TaxID=480071 RepID=UPI00098469CA|nr:spore coat protein [Virgibacillus siamensis]
MQNQQQQNFQGTTNMPSQQQYGAHDMFDAHEALSALIGGMEQYVMYEQHVQDPELKSIMQRHQTFCNQLYNTMVDTFKSGQDPSTPTQSYEMNEDNHVTYGMQPSQPKTPIQSTSELNDQCISGFMLGCMKANATAFTSAALEMSNPVMRRILQDSIPNMAEMAYEVFLYQNKHQYYQVPKLQPQDMQAFQNSYAPTQGNMPH